MVGVSEGRYRKRGGPLFVEWTEALEQSARFLQLDKSTDNGHAVCPIANLTNGGLGDHSRPNVLRAAQGVAVGRRLTDPCNPTDTPADRSESPRNAL